MTFTLIVRSHGRWPYLQRCVDSLDLGVFDRLVLSVDGPCDLEPDGFEVLSTGPDRQGLSANLTQAWGALTPDDEWVFDVEEDFLILDAPLAEMAETLSKNRDVAQMALVRQPWSPEEAAAGGVLHGPHIGGDVLNEGGWLRQARIFTLNPYVAHASLLRSLTPSVEESLTEQLLARGYTFGFWGTVEDRPRVLHIGAEGGMGSAGWKP